MYTNEYVLVYDNTKITSKQWILASYLKSSGGSSLKSPSDSWHKAEALVDSDLRWIFRKEEGANPFTHYRWTHLCPGILILISHKIASSRQQQDDNRAPCVRKSKGRCGSWICGLGFAKVSHTQFEFSQIGLRAICLSRKYYFAESARSSCYPSTRWKKAQVCGIAIAHRVRRIIRRAGE